MRILILIFLTFTFLYGQSAHWERLIDLEGNWRFEIGDNQNWAEKDFDDHDWEVIQVPSSWEDEGFPGYDGYAWYRKTFHLTPEDKGKNLYLRLGDIDDVDQTYINGHYIGSRGNFPPDYSTAFNYDRIYILPSEYLNYRGRNTIAVRVYDDQLEGGIVKGPVGIFTPRNSISLEIDLAGRWTFDTGDSTIRKSAEFKDQKWNEIMVPGTWETQGYPEYDGFAWYRKTFTINSSFRNENLILMLGRIDDMDETYLNGQKIGHTGEFFPDTHAMERQAGDAWTKLRAYYIPQNCLNFDGKNVIAVRVFDTMLDGGIYDGPIGITTRENYLEWRKKQEKENWNWFDYLFK